MKDLLNHPCKNITLALALPGLFLTLSVRPAFANGHWNIPEVDSNPTTRSAVASPGSSASADPGPTSSTSCSSNYTNAPGEGIESASAKLTATWLIRWVNDDGNTPYPTHGFRVDNTAAANGIASPGASGSSSAGSVSGSAPKAYDLSKSQSQSFYDPSYDPAALPQAKGDMAAQTMAGPDNSGDPQSENQVPGSTALTQGKLTVTVADLPPLTSV